MRVLHSNNGFPPFVMSARSRKKERTRSCGPLITNHVSRGAAPGCRKYRRSTQLLDDVRISRNSTPRRAVWIRRVEEMNYERRSRRILFVISYDTLWLHLKNGFFFEAYLGTWLIPKVVESDPRGLSGEKCIFLFELNF
jgi:hypothetical protein